MSQRPNSMPSVASDGTLVRADLTVLLGREYGVAGEMRCLAGWGLLRAAFLRGENVHHDTGSRGAVHRRMPAPPRFADRTEAGERLGEALRERGIDADIVLAVPRGGLPLGRAVADALDAPLDVVVAQKIGAPGNPEYAVGAVASDGSVWRNEAAFRGGWIDEEYFERERVEKAASARRKAERYRGDRQDPDLTDRTVVVVDDGVATGSTVRACLQRLRSAAAERVVLAVPVGPPDTVRALAEMADEVVCLETPESFTGVGQCYERFDQVSDEEAMAYLGAP